MRLISSFISIKVSSSLLSSPNTHIHFFLVRYDKSLHISFNGDIDIKQIFNVGFMIYGTWAFSSSSILMDITKQAKSFKAGYISVLIGMIIGNFSLLFLGYILAKNSGIYNFADFALLFSTFFGTILLVLNIWTTNDSNFYSSMVALQQFGVGKKVSFIVLPFCSALLVIFFQEGLFGIIGDWLVMMGYIGVVFSLLWWYVLLKGVRKKSIINL
ncbi:MAG: hypothetical protein JJW00_03745 [Sulfurimonas sp.]|nr:hypothetical protein [Sulfurimonas sp.]